MFLTKNRVTSLYPLLETLLQPLPMPPSQVDSPFIIVTYIMYIYIYVHAQMYKLYCMYC